MSGPSYVRMYPTDWRSGCLGLSLEQEGLYIRMCMFIAETGRRVPLDDSQAARMLSGTNVNQYRKVLGQLLVLGKVKRHEDGYGNDRIEHETTSAKSASSSNNGSGRKADQGQGREASEATPQVTPQAATPATHPVTTPVVAENIQPNQCALIEPEPRAIRKEDSPLPPDGGRGSLEANSHVETLKAFEAYNDRALVLGLPQASKLTPDRRRRIRARLKDFGSDGWSKALANLDTPFLRGLTEHRFRADLDFVCQAKSFSKLHDGGYAPAQGTPDAADRSRPSRNLSKSERLQAAVDRAMHDNVTVFAARSSWKTADDADAHTVLPVAETLRA